MLPCNTTPVRACGPRFHHPTLAMSSSILSMVVRAVSNTAAAIADDTEPQS
ncbi:hypothetical protein [Denitromonas sp.]|uniref:hypothetical protein n=1 Tax=Denitromonas sp. TaxID=2734609 RepID=UPI00353921BE